MVIGIDFDNTIASYDELMHGLAVQWNWVPGDTPQNKKVIRDALRALPEGELKWRRLQTHCYGTRMCDARPMDGVMEFIAACKSRRVPVWIVSHKTKFANFGDPVDLRAAALAWMEDQGFFSPQGLDIGRERVFFEETRTEKIERIRELGVTHFIDDLEETFLEPGFPPDVEKLLYTQERSARDGASWRAFSRWSDIQQYLLAA